MEVEDDSFFADLTKRISLLVMDEDDNADNSPACYPSVSQQVGPFLFSSCYIGYCWLNELVWTNICMCFSGFSHYPIP